MLRLLLALGVPILVLYLSITCAVAAARAGQGIVGGLTAAAHVLAFAFYGVQVYCAFLVQRALFARPSTMMLTALQYALVLLVCVVISITGAIACEAFGYNVFLRAMVVRGG
ncbi:MAG: hypothetical protein JO061_23975 [Acidobacteriaceae bacterium]|nr:hypothetical protein [Acidobacteriaceae bacterium]